MDSTEIKKHWQELARTFKTDVNATTKNPYIKFLEIQALAREMRRYAADLPARAKVLEVGAGNGQNCLGLAQQFLNYHFTGIDYVPEMIEQAKALQAKDAGNAQCEFLVGDALELRAVVSGVFDIVFTDRCIINLNQWELQKKALAQLAERLRPGGYLLLIENSIQNYARQNDARQMVDLPRRVCAPYNLFLDEALLQPALAECGVDFVGVRNFASLFDIMLYVLIPASNGGEIDYSHPLLEPTMRFCAAIEEKGENHFGAFGQNPLFVFRKNAT